MSQFPNQPQHPYTPPQPGAYGGFDPAQYAAMYGAPATHSGLGIASFIIALLAGLGVLATFIMMAVFVSKHGSNIDQKNPPSEFIGMACGMFVAIAAAAVGLILGIVAVYQRNRKRLFAILGVCLNGVLLLLFALMFLIGLLNR